MLGCERYTALKDWLVRCSAPEKMFQRSEVRVDNDGLFLALPLSRTTKRISKRARFRNIV